MINSEQSTDNTLYKNLKHLMVSGTIIKICDVHRVMRLINPRPFLDCQMAIKGTFQLVTFDSFNILF